MVSAEQKLAIVLLIKEIFQQLDDVAGLMRKGFLANISRGLLQETSSVLKDLDPELQDKYLEILLTLIEHENLKAVSPSPDFIEASIPSKQAFIRSIRQQLLAA